MEVGERGAGLGAHARLADRVGGAGRGEPDRGDSRRPAARPPRADRPHQITNPCQAGADVAAHPGRRAATRRSTCDIGTSNRLSTTRRAKRRTGDAGSHRNCP